MGNVEKDLPIELEDNSKHIVRIRSINNFGVVSDWSESIVVNTEATTSVAGGRLVLTDTSIYGYDGNGKLTFGYFGEGISRTNLVINPSFETNFTGYVGNPFTTLAVSSGYARYGTKSMKLTATAAASGIGFTNSSTSRFAVTPGERYTCSMFVLNRTGNTEFTAQLGFEFFTATGTSLGTIWSPQDITIPVDDKWRRISIIAIPGPSDAAFGAVSFKTISSIPLGTNIYTDGLLVEKSPYLMEYFDGSTNGTKSSWVGVAHASRSVVTTNVGDVYIGETLTIDGFDPPTIKTFYQTNAPVAENVGDLWIDSNDNDKMYRWDGTTWVLVQNKVSTGTIISGNLIRTGAIQSGLYNYTTGTFSNFGMRILLDGNGSITAKEFALDTSGNAFFKGAISGGTIDIGGSDSTSFHVDTYGKMWSGASTYYAAPFRVDSAGVMTAKSGTFSGDVSGGTINIGGSDSTSFHVDAGGNMWSGASTYGAAPFRVSTTGAMRALSGTFSGSITGATGTFSGTLSGATITGGTISIGTSPYWFRVDTEGKIWSGASTYAAAPFRVNSAGFMRATSGTFSGSITGATGTFSGNLSGATITGGTINIGSGNFNVDTSGRVTVNTSSTSNGLRVQNGSKSLTIYSSSTGPYIYFSDGQFGTYLGMGFPNQKIAGSLRADSNFEVARLLADNGSQSSPGISFGQDTNVGFWRAGSDHIELSCGNTRGFACTSESGSNSSFWIPGVWNRTTASGANVNVLDGNGLLQRSVSSIQYKKDVEDLEMEYAEKILDLRPVWFRSKCEGDNPEHSHYGLIAEEVFEIDPRLVLLDEGEPTSVQYDRIVPHLISVVKDQKNTINDLIGRIEKLEQGTDKTKIKVI